MSAFAISEFFTVGRAAARAVLSRYGMDMQRGSALQLGVLKMCGRPLDKLQGVPVAVLEYFTLQVGGVQPEIARLHAIRGQRRRPHYEHQQFALVTFGMTRFEITAAAPGRSLGY